MMASGSNGVSGNYNGARAMVDARDVHKYFHSNQVLRGVTMQVRRGRIFIEGQLVGYREQPDGSIVEDHEKNIALLRSQIGMVFQRFNLFPHLTALEAASSSASLSHAPSPWIPS
jgi:ABC-type histidine transport system ATPase subunit